MKYKYNVIKNLEFGKWYPVMIPRRKPFSFNSLVAAVKKRLAIRKTSKRFDLKEKMWRESYVIFNFFEVIVFTITKGYPCPRYEIITKNKLKLYDGK